MEKFISQISTREQQVLKFHNDFKDSIESVEGSGYNHQYWVGGYQDHLLRYI